MASARLAQAPNQEGKILLAIQAYKKGQISSLNKASALYSVPFSTLWQRRCLSCKIHGMPQDFKCLEEFMNSWPFSENVWCSPGHRKIMACCHFLRMCGVPQGSHS
jgi:hypothetical protein